MITNDAFANSVAQRYLEVSGDKQAVVDIAALSQLIIQIINALAPMVEKCIEARKARFAAGNPTPIQNALVVHKVRQVAGNSVNARQMAHSILSTFATTSDADSQHLLAINL